MRIKALRYLLHVIIDEGYGDWKVYFCDNDNDDYTVDRIYKDCNGDVCLESNDLTYSQDYTANQILSLIKEFDREDYVYFKEVYEDGDENDYYIISNWYIGDDQEYEGYSVLNIDCKEM